MNIRFYPVNLVAALVSVDFDFKIADQWTLGPSLSYWKFKIDKGGSFTNDFQINRYRIGARANWFKNGAFTDGLLFGPSIDYVNIDLSTADSSGPVTAKGSTF